MGQQVERVPIAEAAPRLGLSLAAARKRVQRRQLQAVKQDGQWYVLLSQDEEAQRPTTASAPSQGRPTTTEAVSQPWELPVRILERENATLREQLAVKDRQIGELHVLLQQAQARALPPATEATTPASTAPQTPPGAPRRRRWWQVLTRG